MRANKDNSQQSPTLYRYSSAYRLKASYQRNMLVGLLCASLLVGVPTLVIAWWPAGDKPTSTGPGYDLSPDTVLISVRLDQQIEIIPERRPVPAGESRSAAEGALGTFVGQVVAVPDSLALGDDQPVLGPGGGEDLIPGLSNLPGLGESGGGGAVFIPDTTIYGIGSELDRKAELVAMEKPVYPPLARRAAVEGIVILYVRVGSDGFVEEAEVFSEAPTGYGFGRYAVEAARKAVFVPALYNGQPVRCLVSLTVEFVLGD